MVHPLESPTLCTVPPKETPKRARIIKEVKKALLLIKAILTNVVSSYIFCDTRELINHNERTRVEKIIEVLSL